MKMLSKTSLVLALAFGAASVGFVAPQAAFAAKAPAIKVSDAVRKPLIDAQAAMKKQDWDGALVKINEAKAIATTNDDKFVVNQLLYEVGRNKQDNKIQAEAIDQMLQSGFVSPENRGSFYTALGQLSYVNQDYAKAEMAFDQAMQLTPSNQQLFALAAETKFKLKKPAEAVAMIQRVADMAPAGTPIPQDWYGRGIAIGAEAKLPDAVTKLTMSWLKAYPTQTHWRDSLSLYRDLHKLDTDYSLDVMRLQRAAGALRGERDYVELAEATYLRFPAEAKAVLDSGVSAGVLNLTQMRGAAELSTLAGSKIAADKASLSMNVANAKSAVSTADAYASHGDYASAITLYRKALGMAGADANLVNTHLGAALYNAGQKDEAKTVFGSITGPRADLARYWIAFIETPPTAD
jgi:tetratricopeptide (TPR) repeat protein